MPKPDLPALIRSGQNDQLRAYLDMNPAMAEQTTEQGVSLLLYAAYCRNPYATEVIRALCDELSLHEAAALGDITRLQQILAEAPNRVNETAVDGFAPLGLACFFGQAEAASRLVEQGADVNQASANDFRVTPLHSATAVSHYELVKLLLAHHADVNAQQQSGVTPLHSAAHNGQKKIVELLLKHGADPKLKTADGQSAADLAETDGHPEIAALIRTHSA